MQISQSITKCIPQSDGEKRESNCSLLDENSKVVKQSDWFYFREPDYCHEHRLQGSVARGLEAGAVLQKLGGAERQSCSFPQRTSHQACQFDKQGEAGIKVQSKRLHYDNRATASCHALQKKDDQLLQSVQILQAEIPQADICVHVSLKYQYGKSLESSQQHCRQLLQDLHIASPACSVLLVTGSGKRPKLCSIKVWSGGCCLTVQPHSCSHSLVLPACSVSAWPSSGLRRQ